MNETMLFSFEYPITFERIYDFNNPDHPFNSYWVTEDSNPVFIKFNSYRIKKTLVKNLYIAFSSKHHKYEITLSDDFGYKDDFYVSITEFPNFLKRFGLI